MSDVAPKMTEGRTDRREAIIEAAVHLFHTQGYASTSMQDIAEEVGILKGSLYHYITGKEDLLFEIHDRFMNILFDKAKLRSAATNGSPRERLEGVFEDLLDLIANYRSYVEVFFRGRYAVSGERWDAIAQKRKDYETFVRTIILDGQADGSFRSDLDEQIVAFGLFGMCNWAYQWVNPAGPRSIADIARIFATLYLDGLVPRS